MIFNNRSTRGYETPTCRQIAVKADGVLCTSFDKTNNNERFTFDPEEGL